MKMHDLRREVVTVLIDALGIEVDVETVTNAVTEVILQRRISYKTAAYQSAMNVLLDLVQRKEEL